MMFYALDDHHIVRLFAQGLEHVQERALAGRGYGPREHGEFSEPIESFDSPKSTAPSASCTPNRHSGSREWTAARRSR